jgi:hypothetical protein
MSDMTYSLAEIRNGTGWPSGVRFRLAGSEPVVYLTAADIADHFGVRAQLVQQWRHRYRPGRSAEAAAKAPTCPQPEPGVQVGRRRPQAVWREDRLAEWDEWRASLPGQGAGGGRPPGSAGE